MNDLTKMEGETTFFPLPCVECGNCGALANGIRDAKTKKPKYELLDNEYGLCGKCLAPKIRRSHGKTYVARWEEILSDKSDKMPICDYCNKSMDFTPGRWHSYNQEKWQCGDCVDKHGRGENKRL